MSEIIKNSENVIDENNLKNDAELKLTDDEKIDVAARLILEKYKPALLELAK